MTEGNAYSQILSLMKNKGFNKEVDIIIGVVKQTPPNLLITLERSGLQLDKDDCIVAQHLLEHKRVLNDGVSDVTYTFKSQLAVNDRVIIARDSDRFFIIDKAVSFE